MQKKVNPVKIRAEAHYSIDETKIDNGQVYLKVTEHIDNKSGYKWIKYSGATNDSEKFKK